MRNCGPDTFNNLKDAINGLFQNGSLSEGDKDLVRELSLKDDMHLLAAWDAYRANFDEEEFADTLQVLCDVKRASGAAQSSNEGFGIQMFKNQQQQPSPIQQYDGMLQLQGNVNQQENIEDNSD